MLLICSYYLVLLGFRFYSCVCTVLLFLRFGFSLEIHSNIQYLLHYMEIPVQFSEICAMVELTEGGVFCYDFVICLILTNFIGILSPYSFYDFPFAVCLLYEAHTCIQPWNICILPLFILKLSFGSSQKRISFRGLKLLYK